MWWYFVYNAVSWYKSQRKLLYHLSLCIDFYPLNRTKNVELMQKMSWITITWKSSDIFLIKHCRSYSNNRSTVKWKIHALQFLSLLHLKMHLNLWNPLKIIQLGKSEELLQDKSSMISAKFYQYLWFHYSKLKYSINYLQKMNDFYSKYVIDCFAVHWSRL